MSDKKTDDPELRVGGWQRLSSRVAYENPWIKVFHEEVKTPNGTDGIYGLVHFKGTAVGVVPVDDEGNTWLVRQSRYTLNQFTWEIPEGGAKEGESTLECAKRELAEEAGLQACEWQELLRIHTSNSVTDEAGVLYLARGLSPCAQNLDATEDIEVRKLPLQEAIQMVVNGEITDALSIAALLRLAIDKRYLTT
ncbi:NUDIX hydrolase [Saccharophagus sp. K07]|uniref:NUDIX domain-containing protein n=1 Tax=Saccharophagus sp. K07 TaxID=2283636 RepID=UPI001651F86E|nr:NUDIX hydrolase [Saccharophagus sp. K07]MBC6904562.1 NUDIX hydrolase [Saccharophagus sp. K07]